MQRSGLPAAHPQCSVLYYTRYRAKREKIGLSRSAISHFWLQSSPLTGRRPIGWYNHNIADRLLVSLETCPPRHLAYISSSFSSTLAFFTLWRLRSQRAWSDGRNLPYCTNLERNLYWQFKSIYSMKLLKQWLLDWFFISSLRSQNRKLELLEVWRCSCLEIPMKDWELSLALSAWHMWALQPSQSWCWWPKRIT